MNISSSPLSMGTYPVSSAILYTGTWRLKTAACDDESQLVNGHVRWRAGNIARG